MVTLRFIIISSMVMRPIIAEVKAYFNTRLVHLVVPSGDFFFANPELALDLWTVISEISEFDD